MGVPPAEPATVLLQGFLRWAAHKFLWGDTHAPTLEQSVEGLGYGFPQGAGGIRLFQRPQELAHGRTPGDFGELGDLGAFKNRG